MNVLAFSVQRRERRRVLQAARSNVRPERRRPERRRPYAANGRSTVTCVSESTDTTTANHGVTPDNPGSDHRSITMPASTFAEKPAGRANVTTRRPRSSELQRERRPRQHAVFRDPP
jgi:hypothetical protein